MQGIHVTWLYYRRAFSSSQSFCKHYSLAEEVLGLREPFHQSGWIMHAAAVKDFVFASFEFFTGTRAQDFLSSLLCILQMILQKLLDCMQRFL